MDLTVQSILQILIADTGIRVSVLAKELGRERSLLYKWLSGSSIPSNSYYPDIARIVDEYSTQAQKVLLMDDLRRLVQKSKLTLPVKQALLEIEAPRSLILEIFTICTVNTPPIFVSEASSFREKPFRIEVTVLIRALIAALLGGIIWNGLNRLLGWSYFMGTPKDSLRGIPSVVWGITTAVPIPTALFCSKKRINIKNKLLFICLYGLLEGIAAGGYFLAGLRPIIEQLHLSYIVQETIMVIWFSMLISVPPYLLVYAVFFRGLAPSRLFFNVGLPIVGALVAFFLTLLIARPQPEVLQLRGFVVGFILRLAMFYILWTSLNWKRTIPGSIDNNPL